MREESKNCSQNKTCCTERWPILVVEDDEGICGLIQKTLHRAGYTAEGVRTGAVALKKIKENPGQVLLLDQQLPDMTGIQIITTLQEMGLSLPFIVMTGQGDERVAVKMMKLGAADYLVKGPDFLDLLPGALKRLFQELDTKKRLQEAEEAVYLAELRLRELYELSIALSRVRTLEETLSLSLETALLVTEMDCGGIYLLLEESNNLSLAVHQGFSPSFIAQSTVYPPDSPQFRLVMSGKPRYSNYQQLAIPLDPVRLEERLQAIGIVPILSEGAVIASFNMASHTLEEVPPADRITLESIAVQIGSFIARVKAEETLREQEHKYRAAFDGIHDAITIVSDGGVFIDCNTRALELFGLESKEDFQKVRPADFSPLYQPNGRKSQEIFRQFIVKAVEEQKPVLFEWQHQRKNGEPFLAEVILTAYPIREEMVIQSTIRDITQRKKTEADIKARNRELTSLYTLSTHMRSARNSAELLPIVLDEIFQLIQVDTGMVTLLSPDEKEFTVSAAQGDWEAKLSSVFKVDERIYKAVIETGKPYVVSDLYSELSRWCFDESIGPAVFLPLQSEEKLLGILVVARCRSSQSPSFSFSEIHLLTAIGEMAGNALRRQRLHESSMEQMEQLQALRRIDMAITSNLDLQSTLEITLYQVIKILNVDAAAIVRLFPDRSLKYTAWKGLYCNPRGINLHLDDSRLRRVLAQKEPTRVPEIRKRGLHPYWRQFMEKEGIVGYCSIPLMARDQLQGILEVYHRRPLYRSSDWLKLLETLGGQVAIAMDNDHLFTSLEYANIELTLAYDATIEGWAYALDLRDEETEGHSQRVAKKTILLAMDMDFPEDQLTHLRRAALLHDIGKMGIPDAILLKPGKLTPKEWKIMRRHPQYAWEMLHSIEYLRPSLHVPYCHHEKWDGGGYPQGLKGESIPLEARIFAVVDVYDALTSDRSYRAAWTHEQALELISREKGKHFDPQVADLFLARMG